MTFFLFAPPPTATQIKGKYKIPAFLFLPVQSQSKKKEKKRSSLTRIQEAQNGNFHLCARFQTQIQESHKMQGLD